VPTKIVAPLKETSNAYLLDAVRNGSSLEYQHRIPSATKAGVATVADALTEYRPRMNEFLDGLVNRIGLVLAKNTIWENPLAIFKRGMLNRGDTIEEIMVGLLEAHHYDADREYMEQAIFGQEVPNVEANFHSVNRRDFYKISVNEALLQNAFLEQDGLAGFISQLLAAPTTSDQWDEFLLTCQLFSQYESNGGFYHVNVPDVNSWDSDGTDARMALRKIRAMAENLKFVSTTYNAAKMPTFANPQELVLFATPEFKAATDVEALAAAFNIDKMDVPTRIITIPEANFNIEGAQAVLTTEDFFVIADQRIENTSVHNPVGLHNNYFLHHWEVVSASRFVPAVLFHTGSDDEVITMLPPVQSVGALTTTDAALQDVTSVIRGAIYQVNGKAVTNPAGGANDAVRWSVSGHTSARTFISSSGVLHVSPTEDATTIKVKASSVWVNPENPRDDVKTAEQSLTVTGSQAPEWPEVGHVSRILVKGEEVPSFAIGTLEYTAPVEKPYDKSDVQVFTDGSGDTDVKVNSAKDEITITFDGGVGAPVSYKVKAPVAV